MDVEILMHPSLKRNEDNNDLTVIMPFLEHVIKRHDEFTSHSLKSVVCSLYDDRSAQSRRCVKSDFAFASLYLMRWSLLIYNKVEGIIAQ